MSSILIRILGWYSFFVSIMLINTRTIQIDPLIVLSSIASTLH